MGGAIFVGVRTADGTEHLGTTWTNWLPVLFAEPDLYTPDGGAPLKELIEAFASGDHYDRVYRRVVHSEYGVVLLDLKLLSGETKPVIWTANGYFHPMRKTLGAPGLTTNPRTDELILLHLRRGCLIEAINDETGDCGFVDESVRQRFITVWQTGGRDRGLPLGWLKLDLATEIDGRDRDPTTWKAMRAWLKARGWRAPVAPFPKTEE